MTVGVAIAIFAGVTLSPAFQPPWTVSAWIRHLLAATSCDAAWRVGLAPAKQGMPGFWQQHDADRDGIACEPVPMKRNGYWLG